MPSLQKLFLIQNKITKIERLGHFTQLTMLELGSNKIRVCVKGVICDGGGIGMCVHEVCVCVCMCR